MIISHVKIIAFQTIIIHCLWIFYIARKDCSLYNKQNNTGVLDLEIPDLFFVLSMISRSILEINLVFPRTHVLFSIKSSHSNFFAPH